MFVYRCRDGVCLDSRSLAYIYPKPGLSSAPPPIAPEVDNSSACPGTHESDRRLSLTMHLDHFDTELENDLEAYLRTWRKTWSAPVSSDRVISTIKAEFGAGDCEYRSKDGSKAQIDPMHINDDMKEY